MTVTPKLLIATQASNAQTTYYTVPTDTKTIVDKFTATNTSASAVTLSVNLVGYGGSVGNANLIVKTRTLQPNECYTFPELVGHVLMSGDFISTIASAATSITLRASGREVT